MKVRLFLIAALLMGTVAHMAAQDKKEFTLEVYGGEIPNVKPAFDEEHFLGGEITKKWNTFLTDNYSVKWHETISTVHSKGKCITHFHFLTSLHKNKFLHTFLFLINILGTK